MLLRTYHQMGLQGPKSTPVTARIRPQSPHPFSPSPPPPHNPKTNPTCMSNPTMGQRHNLPLKRTPLPPSTKRAKKLSKKSVEFSFVSCAVSMEAYSPCSAHSRPSRQTLRNERWCYVNNFWSSWHCKRKQYSPTKQATWSLHTSYLSEPKACSRVGGYMFMTSDEDIPTNNGAVLNIL